MATNEYVSIDRRVFKALDAPPFGYYGILAVLGGLISLAACVWMYQMKRGMGVTGLNSPTGWGVYIANFVYWVGIAHSGTLISAILYLLRARFRDAVSRSAEAMTIFAIAIAGMFPLIHLGRFWVLYYILPYPSERQIWPNFISPLLWDVMAISTYFIVSVIFFFVGLIPDLAAAREYFTLKNGPDHPRTKVYRFLSMGWWNLSSQWRHYGRSYLFFAALATPLVISVHSVVSWDFAMSLLPGWHTTIFAPYFVAGAIHSGLAMVLVLLIPMRRILHLESLITTRHFERIAQTLLITTAIVGYAYIVIPFMAWYTNDMFESQLETWRAFHIPWGFPYWSVIIFNVLIPSTLGFSRLRKNHRWLFTVGIVVVFGMWLERFYLVPSPQTHDFLPHNWGPYVPTIIEATVTLGSYALFFFLFLSFSKSLPVIPLTDVKTETSKQQMHELHLEEFHDTMVPVNHNQPGLVGIFTNGNALLHAVQLLRKNGFNQLECYTPSRISPVMHEMGMVQSPVRWWTFFGALFGMCSGYGLALFSALRNHLIVGAKPPVSIIPYTVIAFEFTILFGALFNLIAFVYYSRIIHRTRPRSYDPRFSTSHFGIFVNCQGSAASQVFSLFKDANVEEVKDLVKEYK